MLHENILLLVAMCFGCALLLVIGCATSGGRSVDNTLLEHQREITALETRNAELTRRLTEYERAVDTGVQELNNLGERAAGMGTEVDDVIRLFGEYQQTVEQLLRYYRTVQNKN